MLVCLLLAMASVMTLKDVQAFIVADDLARPGFFGGPGSPALGTDGNTYVVVTCRLSYDNGKTSGNMIAVHISRAGAVLGEQILVEHSCESPAPAIAFDGTNYLVAYIGIHTNGGSGIRGIRLTPTGTPIDSEGGFDISSGSGTVHRSPGIVFDGTAYLVVWSHRTATTQADIFGARVSTDGQSLGEFSIFSAMGTQDSPSVEFSGGVSLVVWRHYYFVRNDLYATRVTPAGVILDPASFAVATSPAHQFPAGISTDGTNFFVVWSEDDNLAGANPTRIRGRRIALDGTLLDGGSGTSGIVINDALSPTSPSIFFDGGDFVIAWSASAGIYSARVSPTGHLIGEPADSLGINIVRSPTVTSRLASPRMEFAGSDSLVIWADNFYSGTQNKRVEGLTNLAGCYALAELFPLKRGNQWSYRYNGTIEDTTTVSLAGDAVDLVDEVPVRTLEDVDGSTESYTAGCQGIRLHRIVDADGSIITWAPSMLLVDHALEVGTVNSSGRSTFNGVNTGDFNASTQLFAPESVTVPAGQFDTTKVRTDFTLRFVGFGVTGTVTNWFAPHIGIVKSTSTFEGITDTLELVSKTVDTDGDGVEIADDNCPTIANTSQTDTDLDLQGDACDSDDDGDGFFDVQDAFPLNQDEQLDTDGDGIGNNADEDDDGDGLSDVIEDANNLDPLNAADAGEDRDGDGLSNSDELLHGTDLDKPDSDGDGTNDGDEIATGRNPLYNEPAAMVPIINLILRDD